MCAGQSTGALWCWNKLGVPILGAQDVIGVSGYRRYWGANGRVYRWEKPGVVTEAAGLETGIDRVIYVEAVGGVNAARGDGTLWTWDFTLPLNPSGLWMIATPTKLAGFSQIASVASAGIEAIVGLRANGRLQAWGDNWIRIGSPTKSPTFNHKKVPAVLDLAVDIDFIENAIDVSLESTFYAANCVLIADGRVRCWSGVYDEVTAKRVTLYAPRDIRYLP